MAQGGFQRSDLKTPASPDAQCLKDMFAMISTLDNDEIDPTFVKNQLEKWFNKLDVIVSKSRTSDVI